jgi:predicted RNA binding protein YcfA (HicA-like mRNA interferase family)
VILAHPATDVTVSVPVHGGRDMKRSLLHGIIADAGLSAEEFAKLLR